jgi:hypothetical protein
MNRDDTLALLRARSALTSQPYGDDAVDTWHEALVEWTGPECRRALIRAARHHEKVTVAHLIEHLPRHDREPPPPPQRCELCDGTGWVEAARDRAHDPGVCNPTVERPCACSAVVPCRCSTGKTMIGVAATIREHNDRHRPHHPPASAPPLARRPAQDELEF